MKTIADDNNKEKDVEEQDTEEEQGIKMGRASYNLSRRMDYNLDDLVDHLLQGDKPTLRNIFQTKASREDKIRFARNHVWSIGLLYRIIKIKTNYISDGFRIYHEDEDLLNKFKELNQRIDIDQYIQNAAFEHQVIGEWYPFLNWNDDELSNLTILDPEKVKVKSIFGQDFVYIKPTDDIIKILNDSDKEVRKRIKKVLPTEYYNKWSKGQEVLLDEDEVFRYFNQKAYHENHSHSPIEPIFDDLALLSMYKDSDYSIAYKIKKAILQVKVGDENYENGEPVDSDLLDAAEDMFKNPSESSEIFTQWFVNAEWIIPETDVYAPEKYKPVIRSIIDWSGLGVFLSQDNTYSSESDRMEAFYMSIRSARKELKKSIEDIYREYAKKQDITDENGNPIYPRVKFSEMRLQNNEELESKVEYLYNHGMLSPETTLDAFGFDFDKEKNIKTEEGKKELYLDIINVPFEPSQDQSWAAFLRKEQDSELDNTMEETTDEEDEEDEE